MSGILKLCTTPIGNLEDITLRVIKAFEEADCIYAEDTRNTLKLLNHLGIKKPLISCHEHNERERAQQIVMRVRQGECIAYASDAGMPGISDPGSLLIKTCIEENVPFELLPGASALPMAAVLSGLCEGPFLFLGFLPRKKKERIDLLLSLSKFPYTLLLYESPLRAVDTLKECYDCFSDRPCTLLRELTKLHETAHRGTLSTLIQEFEQTPPKGECVIAIGAGSTATEAQADPFTFIKELVDQGLSTKDIAKRADAVLGISKNEAYTIASSIKENQT